ncbi:hypothetical protein BDK51DRAFT_38199 [Blyttiomyces helicus]|uniref:Uncharacterized protein n=1 Tax=Blyttiomyces helicus TaxID=388810 RepID=A0A4P9WH63_9FUNG|nr:hypothetical protein BDK51DRAFT_38199 [Blyttiomyces helicus]|eukprot:RKO92161.1 hypothetical protein BDK51DRAFT_38199 [Blyttiomyces helicus]
MESLWKIDKGHFRLYDLLVRDEIESNLKTLAPSTMKLVKTSKQCIYVDAFLCRRTLDVINSIVPFTASNVLSSKDKRVEFQKSIKEKAPEVRGKYYHADANSTLDKDLKDVNESWKDLDCVMYKSQVTVGVKFTIPEHLLAMFMYGFSLSACGRIESSKATTKDISYKKIDIPPLLNDSLYLGAARSEQESFMGLHPFGQAGMDEMAYCVYTVGTAGDTGQARRTSGKEGARTPHFTQQTALRQSTAAWRFNPNAPPQHTETTPPSYPFQAAPSPNHLLKPPQQQPHP